MVIVTSGILLTWVVTPHSETGVPMRRLFPIIGISGLKSMEAVRGILEVGPREGTGGGTGRGTWGATVFRKNLYSKEFAFG